MGSSSTHDATARLQAWGRGDAAALDRLLPLVHDELRRGGHFAGGEILQGPRNAATLRFRDGAVTVTDGPFAETKEQIGGILFLEARDLNEAIQLMSRHPGVRVGPFEIRPVDDLGEVISASEARRRTA